MGRYGGGHTPPPGKKRYIWNGCLSAADVQRRSDGKTLAILVQVTDERQYGREILVEMSKTEAILLIRRLQEKL